MLKCNVRWDIKRGILTYKEKYKNLLGDLLKTDNEQVKEKVVNLIKLLNLVFKPSLNLTRIIF